MKLKTYVCICMTKQRGLVRRIKHQVIIRFIIKLKYAENEEKLRTPQHTYSTGEILFQTFQKIQIVGLKRNSKAWAIPQQINEELKGRFSLELNWKIIFEIKECPLLKQEMESWNQRSVPGSIRREDAKQEKAPLISTPACASKPSVLAWLDSSDEMALLPRVHADLSA